MRTRILAATLAGTMMLGGCATGLGGYGNDPLGGLLGGILGGGYGNYNDGYNANDFERAAVNACGQEASRYGSVRIVDVNRGSDTVRVLGRIDTRDTRRDEFTCTFRSDGRIVDFRTG